MDFLKKIFRVRKGISKDLLLDKFEKVVDGFNGSEVALLAKETVLLSYQGNKKERNLKTHMGEKRLELINWKSVVRSQEVEALNHDNQNIFLALENYLRSSLEDYGLDIKKVKNEIVEDLYNVEVDFKQPFRNDDFFNDLKELSSKVAELDGKLKLYKSKNVESGIWKLVLSVNKNIRLSKRRSNNIELGKEA